MRARLLDRVALESDLRAAIETRPAAAALSAGGHRLGGQRSSRSRRSCAGSTRRGVCSLPASSSRVAEESELIVSLGDLGDRGGLRADPPLARRASRAARRPRVGQRLRPPALARRWSTPWPPRSRSNGVEPSSARPGDHREPADRARRSRRARCWPASSSSGVGDRARRLRHRLLVAALPARASTSPSSSSTARSPPISPARPVRAKIVAATIDMARALGMTIVAEGVETADQVEVLRRLGCDYAQGFTVRPARATGRDASSACAAAYERDRGDRRRTPRRPSGTAPRRCRAVRADDPHVASRSRWGASAAGCSSIGGAHLRFRRLCCCTPRACSPVALAADRRASRASSACACPGSG